MHRRGRGVMQSRQAGHHSQMGAREARTETCGAGSVSGCEEGAKEKKLSTKKRGGDPEPQFCLHTTSLRINPDKAQAKRQDMNDSGGECEGLMNTFGCFFLDLTACTCMS